MTRSRKTLLIVLIAVLVFAPAANAGELVDRAVAALRSDPVYVDPAAERALDDAAADRLRERIANAGAGPVYLAVLPDEARLEAGGDADAVVDLVHRELGRDGTYVVVVGNRFRAGSTEFPRGVVPRLATEAFREHGDEGLAATLLVFVDELARDRKSVV